MLGFQFCKPESITKQEAGLGPLFFSYLVFLHRSGAQQVRVDGLLEDSAIGRAYAFGKPTARGELEAKFRT